MCISYSTLPKGQEDDRFDHEELEHGVVRAEQLSGGKVKQEEGVEREADGDVVDDGHVQVTAGNTANEDREDVMSFAAVDLEVTVVFMVLL